MTNRIADLVRELDATDRYVLALLCAQMVRYGGVLEETVLEVKASANLTATELRLLRLVEALPTDAA